jgi:hypothetical protein
VELIAKLTNLPYPANGEIAIRDVSVASDLY